MFGDDIWHVCSYCGEFWHEEDGIGEPITDFEGNEYCSNECEHYSEEER